MARPRFFQQAADVAHRVVIFGLVSFFGFQVYQIARNTREGLQDHPLMHSTYHEDVAKAVREDNKKDHTIVNERDWYDDDDDTFEKQQIRANITTPEFKQKLLQRQKSLQRKQQS